MCQVDMFKNHYIYIYIHAQIKIDWFLYQEFVFEYSPIEYEWFLNVSMNE